MAEEAENKTSLTHSLLKAPLAALIYIAQLLGVIFRQRLNKIPHTFKLWGDFLPSSLYQNFSSNAQAWKLISVVKELIQCVLVESETCIVCEGYLR